MICTISCHIGPRCNDTYLHLFKMTIYSSSSTQFQHLIDPFKIAFIALCMTLKCSSHSLVPMFHITHGECINKHNFLRGPAMYSLQHGIFFRKVSLRFDSYSFCDWAKSNFLAYWFYRWHFQYTTIRSWISRHICWFLYDLIIYPWLNFKAAHSKSLWARDLVSNYIPQNDNRSVFLSHFFFLPSERPFGNLRYWVLPYRGRIMHIYISILWWH